MNQFRSYRTGRLSVISLLLSTMLTMALCACNTSGCSEGRSGIPKAEFLSSATGKSVGLDSLQIYAVGAPGDSSIVHLLERVSTVYLPLRSTSTVTDWCIAYRHKALDYPELIDTLHFEYTTIPYFVSEECGVGYRYQISDLSYTCHLIDSVRLLDPLVTNIDKNYVAIYFRTD